MDEQKPIEPTYVSGSSPGVTYRIIARTDGGYIAARRIGSQSFRVRAERWDHQPFVVPQDTVSIDKIISLRMDPKNGGARISGIAVGKRSLERAVGVLLSILVDRAFDGTKLEIQPEPAIDAFEAHATSCPHCREFYALDGSEPEAGSTSDQSPAELMSHLPPEGSEPN